MGGMKYYIYATSYSILNILSLRHNIVNILYIPIISVVTSYEIKVIYEKTRIKNITSDLKLIKKLKDRIVLKL